MDTNSTKEYNDQIKMISMVPYLIITFGIAWGIMGLYIFLPEQMSAMFGELSGTHPLFYLAVYAPAIAAFIVILSKNGVTGLKLFLSRFLLFRCSINWYIFILIVIPAVFYLGAAYKGTLYTEPFPFSSAAALFTALLLSIIKGPLEEFGWRGFVQPLLQRKMAPIWAALIIGVIWGFWHLPAFLMSGTQQSAWSFSAFMGGTIAISLIMAALYNKSQGSVFLAALMHFQLMNPILPDAQPYDTYILLPIALIVVWFNRDTMIKGKHAYKKII